MRYDEVHSFRRWTEKERAKGSNDPNQFCYHYSHTDGYATGGNW